MISPGAETDYEPPSHFVAETLKRPYLLWRHHPAFWGLPEGGVARR
jgi:hypothetical protein